MPGPWTAQPGGLLEQAASGFPSSHQLGGHGTERVSVDASVSAIVYICVDLCRPGTNLF